MRKGTKHSEETKKKMSLFRKGKTSNCKGKRWKIKPEFAAKHRGTALRIAKYGEDNHSWKGDNIGYSALHKWVKQVLGSASYCLNGCASEYYDWSNIDHQYHRTIEDWKPLCRKCHKTYDKKLELSKKDYVIITGRS